MALHIMDEVNRCLQCKNPQCKKGCPINTPIPEVISLLKENKLDEADSVIISISQGPQSVIVNSTTGLVTNNSGLLVADELGNTSRPGIFSSGDVVHGPRTVVEAVAHSKVVAETMHRYMQSLKD